MLFTPPLRVRSALIEADLCLRRVMLRRTYIPSVVAGKRIVLIDDSIVRGTTISKLITMLKRAGATEVHVRISSPPFLYPCYYGTDVPSNNLLIASKHTPEEIAKQIGADSLGYLKIEDFSKMVGNLPLCKACFDNQYPVLHQRHVEHST